MASRDTTSIFIYGLWNEATTFSVEEAMQIPQMEYESFPPLLRVAICGGTHGNEMSGVYMIRELQKDETKKADSLSITTVLSNPRAVEVCRRYVDQDLNRCFTDALLSAPVTDCSAYELRRAQELNAQLGPKGSDQAVDLLCDLHNTTSNMGVCILCYANDWVSLHIYRYLKSKMSPVPVRLIQMDTPPSEAFSLEAVGKHGMAIEIGPQPTGVLRADIYNSMKQAMDLTVEWVEQFNSGSTFEGGEIETFTVVERVDFPRDPTTNHVTAAIHPQLQDNDFKLLRPGDPTFLMCSGEAVKHEGEELYPFFINECAYYEKNIAFILGHKITLTIPNICVKKNTLKTLKENQGK